MNELVEEWIKKAEADYFSSLREYRARKMPNYDAAGFHAQQCIEKYFKALLQANNIRFEKIHDLLALKESAQKLIPELEFYKEHLAYLNQFAVAYRYPGELANKDQAKRAVKFMKELTSLFRKALNI